MKGCGAPTTAWERLPEVRRAAIIEAAEDEFAARGFSGGSLNVIARKAGFAKGSLFQYVRDKSDMYADLSERASARIWHDMEAAISSVDWGSGLFTPSQPRCRRLGSEQLHRKVDVGSGRLKIDCRSNGGRRRRHPR